MGSLVLKDAYVSVTDINLVERDLSDHVKKITMNYSAAMVSDTAMGDGTVSNIAGLKNWSIEIEFAQDFASNSVDAILFPLVGAAPFQVKIRPSKDAGPSATNPEFRGNGVLASYPPISGAVGELAIAKCIINCSSDLTRATS